MFANKSATKPVPTNITTQENQPQPTIENSEQVSLKELLASGKPQKCTFVDTVENTTTSGTVYVASSKMRGDFDTQTEGQTTKSHMILDGNTMSIWTDGQTQGFKMSLGALPTPNASLKSQGNVDVDKKLKVNCENWSVDTSEFTLPKDVKFQDFGSFKLPNTNTTPGASDDNSAQCAACNSLSGDNKTQCLKVLSCD